MSDETLLQEWHKSIDALVARMQTPEAKRGIDAFWKMTPSELGEAAAAAGGHCALADLATGESRRPGGN
ncbi:hypothetical protein [Dyella sp. Tek66A03]|uniref:hypothetical protein n=1 Tax=Dyella sp. Tek66A03 TaxID=3458298 RepID=UPI00403E61D6